MSTQCFKGIHATHTHNILSIQQNGFKVSTEGYWGRCAYFFDLNNEVLKIAITHAMYWLGNTKLRKTPKSDKANCIGVFVADLSCEDECFLDLTNPNAQELIKQLEYDYRNSYELHKKQMESVGYRKGLNRVREKYLNAINDQLKGKLKLSRVTIQFRKTIKVCLLVHDVTVIADPPYEVFYARDYTECNEECIGRLS